MSDDADIGSGDRLSFTIFIAAAVHAMVIFGIGFSVNSGKKIAPTLNITLATHQSKVEPEKADFLAQYNQEASGTSDQVRELSTREQATLNDVRIRQLNPIPQQKASSASMSQTKVISATKNKFKQINSVETQNKRKDSRTAQGGEMETLTVDPEYVSLQAKLDKLKQDLANKPRIRRLTSVSTKASYDAHYLNDWAQRIEAIGNQNFPEAALKNDIYGDLRLSVLILPNGFVEEIEILQSSGYPILDEAAIQIVQLASPFHPFPKEIRINADKLEIIRTWRFEITGLKTTL
ncbi:MAG: protein TonB [Lentisphaeria bacterium]|jgi:protein TonB